MARLEAALLDLATGDRSAPLHARLEALLVCDTDMAILASDNIGTRNQRLLRLHRALIGDPIEACAPCPHCRTDNEFDVPEAAILALPAGNPDARLPMAGTGLFRLPRITDLLAADLSPGAPPLPYQIANACRVDGAGALDDRVLDALGALFEAADPAASIIMTLDCAGCKARFQSAVDMPVLAAAGLERLAEGLLRDVDRIASAYGWSEAQILDLPAARRQRYVALIASHRQPAALRRVEGLG